MGKKSYVRPNSSPVCRRMKITISDFPAVTMYQAMRDRGKKRMVSFFINTIFYPRYSCLKLALEITFSNSVFVIKIIQIQRFLTNIVIFIYIYIHVIFKIYVLEAKYSHNAPTNIKKP